MKQSMLGSVLALYAMALGACSSSDNASTQEENTANVAPDSLLAVPSMIAPARWEPGVTMTGEMKVGPAGDLTYHIPLPLPRGAGGLTPSLGLSYSSSAGDGLLGVGWGLEGLATITRCPKIVAIDGTWGTINDDLTDRYCFGGQRLQAISGPSGADGTEYRTESETFARFYSREQLPAAPAASKGPKYFLVETKSGLTMEFGNSADSRIEALVPGAPVRTWALSRVRDALGNSYRVTYDKNPLTGEYVPQRIDYSGNTQAGVAPTHSVRFTYDRRTVYAHPSKTCTNEGQPAVQIGTNPVCTRCETVPAPGGDKTTCGIPCSPAGGWDTTCRCVYEPIMRAPSDKCETPSLSPTVAPFSGVELYKNAGCSVGWFAGSLCDPNNPLAACYCQNNYVNGRCPSTDLTGGADVPPSKGSFDHAERHTANHETGLLCYANNNPIPGGPRTYSNGAMVELTTTLRTIESWVGESLVRQTQLFYDAPAKTGRQRLEKVQACAWDGTCIRPTTFTWGTKDVFTAAPKEDWGSGSTGVMSAVDMNGDGKSDLVQFIKAGRPNAGEIQVALSTGTRFGTSTTTFTTWGSGTEGDLTRLTATDVNGDGRADIVQVGARGMATVWLSTGTSLAAPVVWSGNIGRGVLFAQPLDPKQIHFADFDGDNKADVLRLDTGTFSVRRGTGTTWEGAIPWGTGDAGDVNAIQVVDLNRDLRADVLELKDGVAKVWLSDGTKFVGPAVWGSDLQGDIAKIADANGDGYPDLWRYEATGVKKQFGDLVVWLNTGRGFLPRETWFRGDQVQAPRFSPTTGMVDLNGDGKADLLSLDPYSNSANTRISSGRSFQNGDMWSTTGLMDTVRMEGVLKGQAAALPIEAAGPYCEKEGHAPDADNLRLACSTLATKVVYTNSGDNHLEYVFSCDALCHRVPGLAFADFDGNGAPDMALSQDGKVQIVRSTFAVPDRITKVVDGMSVERVVTYAAGAQDASVYTRGTSPALPLVSVNPGYLVKSIELVDGANRPKVQYAYAGAVADTRGRGFLGFRSMTVTEASGIVTSTDFLVDYPFVGMPSKVETKLGAQILSRTTKTYARQALTARSFPYVSTETTERWDLDGTPLPKQMLVASNVDAFGRVTKALAETTLGRDVHRVTTESTYLEGLFALRGLITSTKVTHELSGKPTIVRTTSFAYTDKGLLDTDVVEPCADRCTNTAGAPNADGPLALQVTTKHLYDAFGNEVEKRVTGMARALANDGTTLAPGMVTRATRARFEANGRRLVESYNALGHKTTYAYGEPRLDVVTRTTDPNGLSADATHNALGRKLSETARGVTSTNARIDCAVVSCPAGVHYAEVSRSSAASSDLIRVWYDRLGREVMRDTDVSTGTPLVGRVERTYDVLGRLRTESLPFVVGSSDAKYHVTTEYDALSRVKRRNAPDGSYVLTTYAGPTTIASQTFIEVGSNAVVTQTASETKNVLGKTARTRDNEGRDVLFSYDALGHVVEVTDPALRVMSTAYDVRGLAIASNDPDRGASTASYNAFGELERTVDAKGQAQELVYDSLGRVVKRTSPEGHSRFTFDVGPMAIGQLTKSLSPNGTERTVAYDLLGRPATSTLTTAARTFMSATTYDTANRPLRVKYPSGYEVTYGYSPYNGQALSVQEASTGLVLWRNTTRDAGGATLVASYGNGTIARRTLNPKTRAVTNLEVRGPTGTLLDNWTFLQNATGSLRARMNSATGLSESITYDATNRIRSVANGSTSVALTYDAIGNVVTKSDVGNYTYAAGKLAGAGGRTFAYDANGQTTSNGRHAFTWDSLHNLVTAHDSVTNTTVLSFEYDANGTRTVKKTSTETTYYVTPGVYEQTVTGATTRQVHWISIGGQAVAQVTLEQPSGPSTPTKSLVYLHRDHLGSVTLVTDSSGAAAQRMSFDAFGRERSLGTTVVKLSKRTFGDHEPLDGVGLIHMNARLYDPVLARFLSPDPETAHPKDSQEYARYSYARNSPLTYADPTGRFIVAVFFAIGGLLMAADTITIDQFVLMFAASAISVITGGAGGSIWGTVLGGVVGGMASAALSGGGIKAILLGALGGALGAAAGYMSGLQVVTKGLVAGVMGELQGGDFFTSMIAGLITSAAGAGGGSMGDTSALLVNAMAGAAASSITGGDAMLGAFSGALNYATGKIELPTSAEGPDMGAGAVPYEVAEERFSPDKYMGQSYEDRHDKILLNSESKEILERFHNASDQLRRYWALVQEGNSFLNETYEEPLAAVFPHLGHPDVMGRTRSGPLGDRWVAIAAVHQRPGMESVNYEVMVHELLHVQQTSASWAASSKCPLLCGQHLEIYNMAEAWGRVFANQGFVH